MKHIKSLLVLILGVFAFQQGFGQVRKGFELMEIVKIAQTYRTAPNLSYQVNYTYADSANPANVQEQLSGLCKLSGEKYWFQVDDVTRLQGERYALTIFSQDSAISVNDKMQYGDVLQLPFMDSVFRKNFVSSMTVAAQNDSTSVMTVQFNAASLYRKYRLYYDAKKYLVRKVEYFVKEPVQDHSNTPSGTVLITVHMSQYSFAPIDPIVFEESNYVYKVAGEFRAKPQYSKFRLLINTSN